MIANHEIERAVLAVATQHGGDGVLDDLAPVHFDAAQNRTIFTGLQRLWQQGHPLDEPSLVAQLTRDNALSDAGGKAGIAALYYHDTALRSSLPSYLGELREAARRRDLARTLAELAKAVEREGDPLPRLIERVESEVLAHTRKAAGESNYVSAETMVTSALELIEQASQRGDGLVGFGTGIKELDELIGGWEPGTFTIVQGPPGVGKTALWLQSALHVAQQAPIAMVQLEMTAAKMGMRALSAHSRVSFRRLRRGADLIERDMTRLSDALGRIAERQMMIAPPGINEWDDIKAWFRRMHIDHGARMLWIDNLKIIGMPDTRPLDRFNKITRECKTLSTELEIPVVAIHHLHRLEEGKEPTLSSGYGSSSIEQDADNVLGLWKPDAEVDDEVELLPNKTRDDHGRRVTLQWIGDQQRYESIKPDYEPPSLPYAE